MFNDVDVGGELQFFLSFHDLFLGVVLDMWKDQERLRAAYYDKVGITGLFFKEKVSPPTLVCTLIRYLSEGNYVSQGFKKDPLWRR
jgi:uncharacterized SAM-dependent methyltransferase